ncbi:hypothetical protein GCM10010317_092390 [Streptomyces mirabilis]|nr:hypothetical protein GCM10010317_092390 [Streptomyces mirabilis]
MVASCDHFPVVFVLSPARSPGTAGDRQPPTKGKRWPYACTLIPLAEHSVTPCTACRQFPQVGYRRNSCERKPLSYDPPSGAVRML